MLGITCVLSLRTKSCHLAFATPDSLDSQGTCFHEISPIILLDWNGEMLSLSEQFGVTFHKVFMKVLQEDIHSGLFVLLPCFTLLVPNS